MVKRLKGVADYVNTLSDDVEKLSDAELRAKTDEFKKRIAERRDLDDLLPEAFAVAREAAWRVLDQRHFDVQVMGGAALHFGNVAEMKTGEGKTLTCVLPAYLNALSRQGRARRHRQRLPGQARRRVDGPRAPLPRPRRRRDPVADDPRRAPGRLRRRHHLRHQQRVRLRLPARQHGALARGLVQRGHNFAIVDEVDSILIDEARTPLIISGPGRRRVELVRRVRPAGAADGEGRPLRGRHQEAHHRRARDWASSSSRTSWASTTSTRPRTRRWSATSTTRSRPRSCSTATRTTSSATARCSSSTSSPAACWSAAATTRACTRPSRPRNTSRSRPRTRRWPRSRCRTTSGSTRSSPA